MLTSVFVAYNKEVGEECSVWKHGGKGRGNADGDDERERSVCRRSSPSSLHLGIEKENAGHHHLLGEGIWARFWHPHTC